MTVFYSDVVSNGEGIQICFKLLNRWKGSLYKLIWFDLGIYLFLYFGLNLLYRFGMNEYGRKFFEALVLHCSEAQQRFPISFLLGFFVTGIISRWFLTFPLIPWMNKPALMISAHLNSGSSVLSRKLRLTIMRYLNLSWILLMRLISEQTAARFPPTRIDGPTSPASVNGPARGRTHRRRLYYGQRRCLNRDQFQPWAVGKSSDYRAMHLTTPHELPRYNSPHNRTPIPKTRNPTPSYPDSTGMEETEFQFEGIELPREDELYQMLRRFNLDKKVQQTFGLIISEDEIGTFQLIARDWSRYDQSKYVPEYWIPIQWAQRLVTCALQCGCISEPKRAYYVLDELMQLRNRMQYLQLFSSIIVPLAYTQVVTIAVYSYFLCQLFASQIIRPVDGEIDLYVPIFSIFSFIFLMGWYKVALCVINPFGDDDEDFQISNILDYNLDISYRSSLMDSDAFPSYMNPNFNISGATHPTCVTPDDIKQALEEYFDVFEKECAHTLGKEHNDVGEETTTRFRRNNFCCTSRRQTSPGSQRPSQII